MDRRAGRPWTQRVLLLASLLGGASAEGVGSNPFLLSYGASAGALLIDREELLRTRSNLVRIGCELQLALAVLDHHLGRPLVNRAHYAYAGASDVGPAPPDVVPVTPAPVSIASAAAAPVAATEAAEPPEPRAPSSAESYAWAFGAWLWTAAMFALDVGVFVGMQLLLESLGGKRRGMTSVMSKRQAVNAVAMQATAMGEPIPPPSLAPASPQRLSVLSQEEVLAAWLSEHWGKGASGLLVAVGCRLPGVFLDAGGPRFQLLHSFMAPVVVMLRCLSAVMLFVRDDLTTATGRRVFQPPSEKKARSTGRIGAGIR